MPADQDTSPSISCEELNALKAEGPHHCFRIDLILARSGNRTHRETSRRQDERKYQSQESYVGH